MASKKLIKYFLLSSASVGGFIAGTTFERKYKLWGDTTHQTFKTYPGLPIYGTVSAATPFSPVPAVQEPVSVNRVAQIMKYGFPSLDNVRSFDDFVLSYDRRNRVAHWVFEHLSKETIKYNEGVERSTCQFKPDESIHPYFR